MKHGVAVLRSPAKRRIRALMMLEFQIKTAATLPKIAKEFNVSVDTVKDTLTWAEKAGLLTKLEDKILEDLMPAAHKAIKAGLEDGDNIQKAARLGIEVFKGIVPGFGKAQPVQSPSDPQGDLASYVAKLRADASVPVRPFLEGHTLPALPPGETSPDAGRDVESSQRIPAGDSPAASNPPSVGQALDEGSATPPEGE